MRYLLPKLNHLLFMAIFIGAMVLGPRMLSLDSDLGRHLTLGKVILDTHQIPTTDIFSFTKTGEPRPPYEWLTQVFFAFANRLAGLGGVIIVTGVLIATAFLIVYVNAIQRSGMPLTALVITVIAAAASSLHWLPRPHVVTFLLLAIWLERLERARQGEAIPLWQPLALMLIWVNAHGGFVFGILAWMAYFAGWVWEAIHRLGVWRVGKQWMMIGVVSVIATFLTPSLYGNWQAVLNNHSRYILSRTVETMSPNFGQSGTWPFLVLLALALVMAWKTRKTFAAAHVFLLGGFALLGLSMARNIPLFAITAAPILAERLSVLPLEQRRWKMIEENISRVEKNLRGAVWPIAVVVGAALVIGIQQRGPDEMRLQFNKHVFPVEAVTWLEMHPQAGNMFNEFNWGGYLLYRLWPTQLVFIDSQTDFYGEGLVREYEMILLARPGWEAALEAHNIQWVILPPDANLARQLGKDSAWETLYADETAVILRQK